MRVVTRVYAGRDGGAARRDNEVMQPWLIYALLGAVCAGLVSIFAKRGMEGVDAGLATTVRSVVMTVFLVGLCSVQGKWAGVAELAARPMGLVALSGVAGALSWLFMFKALSLAEVTKVNPIDKLSLPISILLAVVVFRERPTWVNWVGIGMIVGGTYLAALPKAN